MLVRFLQAAIDADGQDQIATLRAELEFVQLVYVFLFPWKLLQTFHLHF